MNDYNRNDGVINLRRQIFEVPEKRGIEDIPEPWGCPSGC
jgi:hypothetical protein